MRSGRVATWVVGSQEREGEDIEDMGLNKRHADLLRRYIETPSVTGQPNGELVTLLEDFFAGCGRDAKIIPSPSYPGHG